MVNAYRRLRQEGWNDRLARIKSFCKWEKFDATADLEQSAVRLIQHRSDEYCYTLARWLKPIEKKVLYKKARGVRPFAKAMTPKMKAKRLREMTAFSDPVFVLLDHSRYDAHLVKQIRARARRYFEAFYPGDSRLHHMLKLQEKNKCTTANGIKYEMEGTMCSGDYNTSLEDNIVNYAIIRHVFRNVDARILVDGDDSVVVVSARQMDRVNLAEFSTACLTTKVELKYLFEEVDFCQMKPIRTGAGLVMVRDPNRVMSRSSYTCKSYNTQSQYESLGAAVAACEMSCNRGVPILQAYSQLLMRSTENARVMKRELENMLRYRRVGVNLEPIPVTPEARLDFWLAFGIDPRTQRRVEHWLSTQLLPVVAMQVTSERKGL